MNKLSICLVTFCFIIFAFSEAFAQTTIPNGCFGTTYGDSPSRVKEIMAKKGGCVEGETPNENEVLVYRSCSFAGHSCAMSFGFVNKKLHEVNILYSAKGYDTWIAVYKGLFEKYGTGETVTRGGKILTVWADEKNGIVLKLDENNYVWLLYSNGELNKEANEKNKSDY